MSHWGTLNANRQVIPLLQGGCAINVSSINVSSRFTVSVSFCVIVADRFPLFN